MALVNIGELTIQQIASICDHTFLDRPEQYPKGETVAKLREKKFWQFLDDVIMGDKEKTPYGLCVRPEDVPCTVDLMRDAYVDVIVSSVVGFPGSSYFPTDLKVAQARFALMKGAKEIDMVINYKELRDENWRYVEKDITKVKEQLNKKNNKLKVILETCELSPEEIVKACEICTECEVDFIKTSTGFGKYGAREKDIRLMKEYFKGGIKISGGVDKDNVYGFLRAASREDDENTIDLDPDKIRIGESSLLKHLK